LRVIMNLNSSMTCFGLTPSLQGYDASLATDMAISYTDL